MRDVTSQEGLEKVFGVLRMPYAEDPANWSRRFKAIMQSVSPVFEDRGIDEAFLDITGALAFGPLPAGPRPVMTLGTNAALTLHEIQAVNSLVPAVPVTLTGADITLTGSNKLPPINPPALIIGLPSASSVIPAAVRSNQFILA